MKEQAGDANGGEENGERVPHEAEVLGLIEMRGEQDGNEEVLFDAAEGPMAAVQVEGERVANSVRVTRPWLSKKKKLPYSFFFFFFFFFFFKKKHSFARQV